MFSSIIDYSDASRAEAADATEIAFELGTWFSGLSSYLVRGGDAFSDGNGTIEAARDYTKECRLTHAALLRCSRLNIRLRAMMRAGAIGGITGRDLDQLSLLLREAIILTESVIRSGPLKNYECRTVSSTLSQKFADSPAAGKILAFSEQSGEEHLPRAFWKLLDGRRMAFADEADLRAILPRFGHILKSLSIVGRMLRFDEPLKPALLIFLRVHEQTQDLISHINNRLSRFPDESAELFSSLDGASYMAGIELKKVYNHELTGLLGIRPAPSVYARIETAYSLLTDGFLHILAGFARLIDPAVTPFELFPSFQVKLDQSLILRDHLWKLLTCARAAEHQPEKKAIDELRAELNDFLRDTLPFLFYKDTETVERFCEEILATDEKKDLVPILHRFGAYLETLFGQVNMRAVLSEHPFDSQAA